MAVMEKMGIGIGMMNFDAPTVFAHLQNMQLNTSVQISGNNNKNNNVEEEVEQKNVEQNTDQNNADNKKEEEQNLQQKFSDTEENNGKAKRNVRDLVDLLSKLNPFAKEFVPTSHLDRGSHSVQIIDSNNKNNKQKKVNKNQGKRPVNNRTSRAQREDNIRRTVYVSDIDHQVTEEQLAALFLNCGQVVDCRICGDPNSVLRFAFVEFANESGARAALSLAGTMLGYYPVRVLPSKTAIAPVNPTFLPRSEEEREKCARTVYCTNIDKKVSQSDLKVFFETLCGGVSRLRLLGDFHHSTRIAFVEFFMAESAMAALNCSGAVLGQLPIRVSPSKTPVRTRSPRPTMQ